MEWATRLFEQAREYNERRLLVLSGSPTETREVLGVVLDALDVPLRETTYVGPSDQFHCESLKYDEATTVLGTTRTVVVLDCHRRFEPNVLGQLVGTVDGGGLLILLTPPLSSWANHRDAFDETLAVPPFEVADVTGHLRERLVETLRQHRGIALVDTSTRTVERDGLVNRPPSKPGPEPTPLLTCSFPRVAYEHCLTGDQVETLEAFESLISPDCAVVVEANRGRGKSSVAGLAAASLALDGQDVLVTAPQYRNAQTLLQRAETLLEATDSLRQSENDSHTLETPRGRIRYVPPDEAASLPDDPDSVFVDEAAALPVRLLAKTLDAPRVAYITTTHGYEGAGRGFTVRFRDHLESSTHELVERRMTTPIRYAPGDPIEVWSFRALALDARPPVDQIVSSATGDSVAYRRLSSQELLDDESLLREVFGLLVLAHYRTEPNDLARLLDAPNVSAHGLFHDGHPVSVALLAREGGLSRSRRRSVYEGSRVRGNLIPDVLTSQLRDEDAGTTVGYRVMRIATHSAVRSRGLGSQLLSYMLDEVDDVDWFGVGYGATPELVEFWRENGFSTVHLSTTRNPRSGEHSAVMLRPLSDAGERLLSRHTRWLLDRFPGMLPDSLKHVDPDVVRAVCRSLSAPPALELTDWEWRHAAAVAAGPGIFEMAPHPIRALALYALVEEPALLSPSQERLLVRRALQLQSRETVASELGYHSESNCMRTLGEVVRLLLEAYGPAAVEAELERLSSHREP